LFGTEDNINEAVPTYRIEYLEIAGISYENAPTRYNYRISSEKNLFLTFFDVYERLMKKIEIPFLVKQGVRDDDPPALPALSWRLPERAVCEDLPRGRLLASGMDSWRAQGT